MTTPRSLTQRRPKWYGMQLWLASGPVEFVVSAHSEKEAMQKLCAAVLPLRELSHHEAEQLRDQRLISRPGLTGTAQRKGAAT